MGIFFKEKCWFLYGHRINFRFRKKNFLVFVGIKRFHAEGTEAEVVMDYVKASDPRVIGWYHTHPGYWNVLPSATDNSTMRSWIRSMYKPYLCGIQCEGLDACYCYYVGGVDRANVTIVERQKVKIRSLGPLFISWMESK